MLAVAVRGDAREGRTHILHPAPPAREVPGPHVCSVTAAAARVGAGTVSDRLC